MIIQQISNLKKYNFSNELKFFIISFESIAFHENLVFPYNILVMVKTNDQSDESYIDCRQTETRYVLEASRYYFIPAGLGVEYYFKSNITYYTFHVGLELFPGIDLYSSFAKILSGDAGRMMDDIERIYAEQDEFLALCYLREFFFRFFTEHWPERHPLSSKIPENFCELMRYIKAQSDATMTVDALADRVKMTREAFSRKFHLLIKMTPKSFISKCIVEKITSYLCDSDMTVKEISKKLNFSSEFYLSRFYKKSIGIAPHDYRKMIQKK